MQVLERFRRTVALATLAFAAALPLAASAEYPDKPIKLIVPWPAGGGSDVVARQVAQPLGEKLKQAVVIENRPGANGAIGSDVVARAAPDGYTLVWVTADTHAMNPHVYPKLAYDPRAATAIGMVGYFPYALIINPNFPANNIAEFVAQAKEKPGKVTFASWGIGGSSHVAMEMFRAQGKFDVLHVPYTGAAPAIQGVISGQVDSMIVPMSVAGPQQAGGKVRVLGLASPKRFAGAPALQTFAEQGVPVNAGTWVGLMGPPSMPSDIVAKLNTALNEVVNTPAMKETLIKLNVEPATQTPQEFRTFVDTEYERWGKTIREAKIRVE